MIAAIGPDRTTPPATRLPPGAGGANRFAAAFAAMTAPAVPTSRPAPPRDDDRTTAAQDQADRLEEAVAAFRKELSMTPAERVRRDVLKTMNLTEEAIEVLPPKERVEVEQKVAMEVARRMKVMQGGSAGAAAPVAGAVPL